MLVQGVRIDDATLLINQRLLNYCPLVSFQNRGYAFPERRILALEKVQTFFWNVPQQ